MNIKFPSLIVFNDGSMKLVHRLDEINGDIEWSVANYDKKDFIIDSDLTAGRFVGSKETDELLIPLLPSNIISHACSEDECQDIAKILKENIDNRNLDDEEISFAKDIIQKINNRK